MKIPFNRPFVTGKETGYIKEVIESGETGGDGAYTKKCNEFFRKKYGFQNVFLTTSCTDALEMAAILIDIKEGDEVIIPSYTFVSTANAFILRGAKIVFADSCINHPNLDVTGISRLITKRTKAIVPVHYAGVSCQMEEILELASEHGLYVIEDAAQAIDSYYYGKPLGSLGNLAAFSFHESKNVVCGEGGMLVVNDEKFLERAEIIREKGTNRSKFFRGEIDKYGWVDLGSSFLLSDVLAAYLFAQCEQMEKNQAKRVLLWNHYFRLLKNLEDEGKVGLPVLPGFSTNNAHIFYIVCRNLTERQELIKLLKRNNISTAFHYLALHKSRYFGDKHDSRVLENADRYTDCLLRLPLYYDLELSSVERVCDIIKDFYSR